MELAPPACGSPTRRSGPFSTRWRASGSPGSPRCRGSSPGGVGPHGLRPLRGGAGGGFRRGPRDPRSRRYHPGPGLRAHRRRAPVYFHGGGCSAGWRATAAPSGAGQRTGAPVELVARTRSSTGSSACSDVDEAGPPWTTPTPRSGDGWPDRHGHPL